MFKEFAHKPISSWCLLPPSSTNCLFYLSRPKGGSQGHSNPGLPGPFQSPLIVVVCCRCLPLFLHIYPSGMLQGPGQCPWASSGQYFPGPSGQLYFARYASFAFAIGYIQLVVHLRSSPLRYCRREGVVVVCCGYARFLL